MHGGPVWGRGGFPHHHGGPGGPRGGRGFLGRGGPRGLPGHGGRGGWRHHPYGHSLREEFFFDGRTRVHNVWTHRDGNDHEGEEELPHAYKIAQELALEVIEQAQLNPETTTVLDFGFDTTGESITRRVPVTSSNLPTLLGFLASRVLQPHVKSLVGLAIDNSAVDAYNNHATTSNITAEQMRAIRLPFMGHLSSLEGQLFDIILCGQPIEQRPDIADVVPALAQFLKPGGTLFVVTLDLAIRHWSAEEEATSQHSEHIQEIFRLAGLEAFTINAVDSYGFSPAEPGVLFVAKAIKPEESSVTETASTIDGDEA